MLTPQHVRRVYVCVCLSLAAGLLGGSRVRGQQAAAGGFIESALTTVTRPLAGIANRIALPVRGAFVFPAPYSTAGVRLTTPADCGGADCVTSVGYSYWRNMNNHTGSDTILVFLTLDRRRGGGGPTLFSYSKSTGDTQNRGPLFDPSDPLSWATGEGWYFSATLPTTLYLNEDSRMLRYDVVTHARSTVVDIANFAGPNRTIWQMHSSNDDSVHSFTVEDAATSAPLGCAVYLERAGQYRFFAARGEYDECQIDKSGRYLVIKENVDGAYAEDNVVEDLTTGAENILLDQNGAMGHSDLGFGYGVGEDNWNAAPGAMRVWRYDQGGITDGRVVFEATDWNFGANHIAHSNAQADRPLEQQVVCSSNASRLSLPHTNEILCYRLDGSLNVLVVAPVMTDLDASGGGSDDYTKEPKGNLDVTGQYFLWTSNMGGARQDAFLVHVPLGALGINATAPTSSSAPSAPGSSAGAPMPGAAVPVDWVRLVHARVDGTTLRKDSGCGGCADAGASSQQQIASGDGYLEFVASETNTTREIGLSHGDAGTSGDEIQFGLRLTHGVAEVRERSVYRADTPFQAGDRLRIQIANGVVSYAKNGATFYTSQGVPQYPLLVDSSLYDVGATLTGATLTAKPGSSGPSGGFWTSLVNATVTAAGLLQKTGGCDGCPDAGAVSAGRIGSGDGRVVFGAGGAGIRFVGLGPNALGTGADLPFAFRLSGAVAEVREYGRYVGEVAAAPSDTLAIIVASGRVQYARNGVVFYTSASGPLYPLYAAAALYSLDATVPTPTWVGP